MEYSRTADLHLFSQYSTCRAVGLLKIPISVYYTDLTPDGMKWPDTSDRLLEAASGLADCLLRTEERTVAQAQLPSSSYYQRGFRSVDLCVSHTYVLVHTSIRTVSTITTQTYLSLSEGGSELVLRHLHFHLDR